MRPYFLVLGQGGSIGVSLGWRAGLGGELWTVSDLNVVKRKSVDEERTATLPLHRSCPLHGVTWGKNVMEIWCDTEKESTEIWCDMEKESMEV